MEGKTIFVGAKAGAFFFLPHDSAVRAWSSGKTRILTRYGRDSKKMNPKKETALADFNEICKKFQFEFNPAISEYSIPEEYSFFKLTENDKEMLKFSPLPIPFTRRNALIGFDTSDECAFNWAVLNNEESKKRNAEAATFIFKDKNGKYYTQKEPSWFGIDSFDVTTLNKMAERTGNYDQVVGVAHTHGAEDPNYNSEVFSNEIDKNTGAPFGDIPFANEFGIPIYLSTPKDTFRVYVPGKGEDKLFMGNAK